MDVWMGTSCHSCSVLRWLVRASICTRIGHIGPIGVRHFVCSQCCHCASGTWLVCLYVCVMDDKNQKKKQTRDVRHPVPAKLPALRSVPAHAPGHSRPHLPRVRRARSFSECLVAPAVGRDVQSRPMDGHRDSWHSSPTHRSASAVTTSAPHHPGGGAARESNDTHHGPRSLAARLGTRLARHPQH